MRHHSRPPRLTVLRTPTALALACALTIAVLLPCSALAQDQQPSTADVVRSVATERFEPILLTSLVISAFVLPLAVLGGRPGLEILHPMSVTILGGLVTAALASLVLLPVCCRALRIGLGAPVSREASYANS